MPVSARNSKRMQRDIGSPNLTLTNTHDTDQNFSVKPAESLTKMRQSLRKLGGRDN